MTARSDNDAPGRRLEEDNTDSNKAIVEAVTSIAPDRERPMSQIALAWVLSKPAVSAPIVGATKIHHLEDAINALDIDLTEVEIDALERHYIPRQPLGF